jgi:hypothetical protein
MGPNEKDKKFNLNSFYHQIRTNCTEFGIQRYVIDRFVGQVEDINRKNTWKLQKEEHEDA